MLLCGLSNIVLDSGSGLHTRRGDLKGQGLGALVNICIGNGERKGYHREERLPPYKATIHGK